MTLNNMTPNIGDKFELLGMEWEVKEVSDTEISQWFKAEALVKNLFRTINLHFCDASKLNWIKPEVKLSKEQAQRVKEIWNDTLGNPTGLTANKFKNEIDKITE